MHVRGQFKEVDEVFDEYSVSDHAEPVVPAELEKPPSEVFHLFYLPIHVHVVRMGSSITTKVRAVFDASAKTSTGVSLNDILLVGPMVHPPLVDVPVRLRFYHIALVAEVRRMYKAIRLSNADKDLHHFISQCSTSAALWIFK